jgi:hypothetical protein
MTTSFHADANTFAGRFAPAGFALLVPATQGAPLAVALTGDQPPTEIFLRHQASWIVFERMRTGALPYGLPELFLEKRRSQRDPVNAEEGWIAVSDESHYAATIDCGANVFGASDIHLRLPFADGRRLYSQVSIPVTSPKVAMRAEFEIRDQYPMGGMYSFVELSEGVAWLCPICGKACDRKEPHNASHGAPGHLVAGTGRSSFAVDVLGGRGPRIDDPADMLTRGY